MDNLIIAILDKIESELSRNYWNKNHKEISSPFSNTGEVYSNDYFTVRAYGWEDNTEPNFDSDILKCWWYKHSHRGLQYEINPDITADELCFFLNKCIDSIKEDFERK